MTETSDHDDDDDDDDISNNNSSSSSSSSSRALTSVSVNSPKTKMHRVLSLQSAAAELLPVSYTHLTLPTILRV